MSQVIEKNLKKYLKKEKNFGIDTGLSSLTYLSLSEQSLGNYFLKSKFLKKISFFSYLKFFFLQLNSINLADKYYIASKIKYHHDKKNIILTWGKKNNFNNRGVFFDPLFNVNSSYNQKKNLWIIIYHGDKKLPNRISSNIILLHHKEGNKINNYFLSIVKFIKYLFFNKFNFRKISHYSSFTSFFALSFYRLTSQLINMKYVSKIIMSYEGQPFQNYFIKKFKDKKKNIQSLGIITNILPHNYDLIKRIGSPDKLILSSKDQKKYFNSYLGWEKDKLSIINSTRMCYEKKTNINNKIFLPNYIKNLKDISNKFEKYIDTISRDQKLPVFKIKSHPNSYSFNKQAELKNNIQEIIKKNFHKFDKKKKSSISIVIGLTSSPIYLLENGIDEVIHITEDLYLNSYNNRNWSNISSKLIDENIIKYKMKKKSLSLLLSAKKNDIKKFLN